jgi:hypothetical protein
MVGETGPLIFTEKGPVVETRANGGGRPGEADDVDGPSLGVQARWPERSFFDRHREGALIMRQIVRIGLDIAKRWFQVRAVDEANKEVFNRKLPRDKVLVFLGALPPSKSLSRPARRRIIGAARSNGWAIACD